MQHQHTEEFLDIRDVVLILFDVPASQITTFCFVAFTALTTSWLVDGKIKISGLINLTTQ